jgi:hypothetical protein
MRPSSCTATRECTPARAHIREASKLSPLSLSHSNLSLLSRATDLQHRMACGVQLGQYCSASSSLSLSLCTVTYCFSSPPIERERVCVCVCRESQVHGQGLFFGCLVVFCNSVAPHGVTCSSASPSPIPGLLFSPLSLFCSYTTTVSSCCLLVCIDCLADLNLHPFPKEINISSIQLFFY